MPRTALPLATLLLSGSSLASPSIEYIETGYAVCSLSYDGTAAAGNAIGDFSYETFRWTPETGIVRLGLATVPVINRGSGTPNISYNGNQVSASILSSDWQLTQGLWNISSGWVETMPPSPPGGALVDDGYGSAWGLSGNGKVVTGFFWSESYRAQASAWSAAGGMTALGQVEGRSARANAASYDGSVAGGWEENDWGSWMPRVWRSGVKHELSNDDGGVNMVEAISGSGDIVVGSCRDESIAINVATLWTWNGASYDTHLIGSLPDYSPNQSYASFVGISNDGNLAVGFHAYDWSYTDAIIWTPSTGIITATDFLSNLGLTLEENLVILDAAAVSPDGSTIALTCLNSEWMEYVTALVRLRQPCPGDLNNDGLVDDLDFVIFANSYNVYDCADPTMPDYCLADLNRDEVVDDNDFVIFANAYDQLLCP